MTPVRCVLGLAVLAGTLAACSTGAVNPTTTRTQDPSIVETIVPPTKGIVTGVAWACQGEVTKHPPAVTVHVYRGHEGGRHSLCRFWQPLQVRLGTRQVHRRCASAGGTVLQGHDRRR